MFQTRCLIPAQTWFPKICDGIWDFIMVPSLSLLTWTWGRINSHHVFCLFQAKRKALGMLRYAKYLGFLKVFGWQDVHQVFLIDNMCIWGVRKCGYPNNWLVYFMENPKIKWMMNRGTPILGNLHIYILPCGFLCKMRYPIHPHTTQNSIHWFSSLFFPHDGHLGGHIQTKLLGEMLLDFPRYLWLPSGELT